MASDSTRITSSDPFAQNDPNGRPNSDGLTTEGVSGGSFDISNRFDPEFEMGQTTPGAARMTLQPDPPGSRRLTRTGEQLTNVDMGFSNDAVLRRNNGDGR